MNVFKKRPLCLILCIMLTAFSLFLKLNIALRLCIAGAIALIFSVVFIIFNSRIKSKILPLLAISAFAVGIALSVLFTYIAFPSSEQEGRIKGRIESMEETNSYSVKLVIDAHTLDDESFNHKLISYADKETVKHLKQGYIIDFKGKIIPLSRNNKGFDEYSYYSAKGITAILTDIDDIIICSYKKSPIKDFFYYLNKSIGNRFREVTNESTGDFLAALLVGDRNALDGNINLNFSRLGISHILALSGGHLVILSAALTKLLSLLYIEKRKRSVIIMCFTIFYMVLTGLSPSITRAGIMIIIYYFLYLFKQSRDSYTSLSISIFLIILFDPFSALDISLWLSAFATLGVICYKELKFKIAIKGRERLSSVLTALLNALLSTMLAISATFAVTMLVFDSFSAIAPFTTLIFSFAIQMLMYLAILAALLPFIPFLGNLTVIYSDVLQGICGKMAEGRNLLIRFDNPIILIAVSLLCLGVFLFFILDIKKKARAIAVITAVFSCVFLGGYLNNALSKAPDEITVNPLESCDIILIRDSKAVTLVYMGDNTSSSFYECYEYLYSRGITYVDNLILTSYRHQSAVFVEEFTSGIKIEHLKMPMPDSDAELQIAYKLSLMLSDSTTDLDLYEDNERLLGGSTSLFLLNSTTLDDVRGQRNALLIGRDGRYCTYLSAGIIENDIQLVDKTAIASQCIVIGKYGEKLDEDYEIAYDFLSAEYIIDFSDAYISEDMKDYYNKKGASVIETDTPIEILNIE